MVCILKYKGIFRKLWQNEMKRSICFGAKNF